MADDQTLPLSEVDSAEDFATDFEALTAVARAFQRLDHAGRLRLLRTVATFFKLELTPASIRDAGRLATVGASDSAPVAPFSENRAPSPKDFMRDKKPVTDVERIACLAYYLTHYRDTPHFKTIDLSKLNTEAAQIKLSNPTRAVDNATRTGLLAQAVKGTKQLSAPGEEYVQALPDRALAKEVIAHARPRRRARRSSSTNQPNGSENGE